MVEFGSIEDHFKYRQAVIEAYPCGNYPVFEGYDHMQYQIRDPKGFAEMLAFIAAHDGMPKLPFIDVDKRQLPGSHQFFQIDS